MNFWNLRRGYRKDKGARSQRPRGKSSQRQCTLGCEQLEDRITPSNPGELDTSFGIGGTQKTDFAQMQDEVHDVLVQADDKIVVVGWATSPATKRDFAVVRYNKDGSLDSTFGTGGKVTTDFFGGSDFARTAAIQSDGKIVVGGFVQGFDFALVRYNTDGGLDQSFGNAGKVITDFSGRDDAIFSIAIQPDGKIIAGGYVWPSGSRTDFALARYKSNGSLDHTFGNNGIVTTDFAQFDDVVYDITIQPDGRILAGGTARVPVGAGRTESVFALARYTANGTPDTTFGINGLVTTLMGDGGEIKSVTVQPGGNILVAGTMGGFTVARYTSDGDPDNTFGNNGNGFVNVDFGFPSTGGNAESVILQPDGKILAAGTRQFGSPFGFWSFGLARLNTDGTPDQDFGNSGTTTALGSFSFGSSVALQSDGNIIVAGYSLPDRSGSSQSDFAVARFHGDPDYSLLHTLHASPPVRGTFEGTTQDLFIGLPSSGAGYGRVDHYSLASGQLIRALDRGTLTFQSFGVAMATSSGKILVSAPRRPSGNGPGEAFLFDISTGTELLNFHNPSPSQGDLFGEAVALNNRYALIGAPFEDDFGNDAGAAYVFDAVTGQLLHTLANPTPGLVQFGRAVAIAGNHAIVSTTGTVGIAQVFDISTGSWLRSIVSPNPNANHHFASTIAAVGNKIVVGEPLQTGPDRSSAYLFDPDTGNLVREFHNPTPETHFGIDVANVAGNALIGGFASDRVHLYSPDSDQPIQTFENPDPSRYYSFGSDVAGAGDHVLIAASIRNVSNEFVVFVFAPNTPVADIEIVDVQHTNPTTVKFTYSTVGDVGSFDVGFFRSADDQLDPTDEEVQRITITPTGGQGTHTQSLDQRFRPDLDEPYIIVVADPPSSAFPDGAIAESDESNNTGAFQQDILEWYAPILHIFEDDFRPKEINSMLQESVLRRAIGPDIVHPSIDDLTGVLATGFDFLDMETADPGYIDVTVPEVSRFDKYETAIYGRVAGNFQMNEQKKDLDKLEVGQSYTVLQYWFFYPYNDWRNKHEGDWEMVQVIINPMNRDPLHVTFSWHWAGSTEDWEDLKVPADNDHFDVYVTRGGHGSWPSGGPHDFIKTILGKETQLVDETPTDGIELHSANSSCLSTACSTYSLLEIPSDSWNAFLGRWGEVELGGSRLGTAGPLSPSRIQYGSRDGEPLPIRWVDPLGWANDPVPDGWFALANSPVDLSVFDSGGRRVGEVADSEIQSEIPGTYLLVPSEGGPESVIILGASDLKFQLNGTDFGTMDFSISRFGSGEQLTVSFENVPLSPSFVGFVGTTNQVPANVMDIDSDGDGRIDQFWLTGAFPSLREMFLGLPDEAFKSGKTQRRTPLSNKVEAVENMIRAGNYYGAIAKLRNDVSKKVDDWLIDTDTVLGQITKDEIEKAIEALLGRLEALL